jgi:hypothetical protein
MGLYHIFRRKERQIQKGRRVEGQHTEEKTKTLKVRRDITIIKLVISSALFKQQGAAYALHTLLIRRDQPGRLCCAAVNESAGIQAIRHLLYLCPQFVFHTEP